jgi:arginyl-tRNA synthetase
MEEAALERVTDIDSENKNALAEAVAVAALKYQILKHNVGSNIVFDKEKALSFEGDSGPYLQYTHARINSVLKKAESAGVTPSYVVLPEQPYLIEKITYRFEEVVAEAVQEQAPQKVVNYLTELSGAFNTFYAHEKMADVTDEFAPYKCLLAQAVATTLKNGLFILAIKAPERL